MLNMSSQNQIVSFGVDLSQPTGKTVMGLFYSPRTFYAAELISDSDEVSNIRIIKKDVPLYHFSLNPQLKPRSHIPI